MKNVFKRTLAIFLTIVMTIGIAPLLGFVGIELPEIKLPEWNMFDFSIKSEALTKDVYTYSVSDGEVTITDCDTSVSGALVIPSTLGGYRVTNIGTKAFSSCKRLTSVTIPVSVTSIGDYAFDYCFNLEDVYYTGNIESWCNIFFGNADANPMCYADNFYINNTLVKEIVIPDTMTEIKDYAFYGCTCLTDVYYTGDIESWCNISFGNCFATPMCYADNFYINNTLVKEIVIPDTITEIKDYTFCDFINITSVTIPNSVTTIGDESFYRCKSLSEIIIPDSVSHIGEEAFAVCTSIVSIEIPDSVTSIGVGAFALCVNLKVIEISDSVRTIEELTFFECEKLEMIVIPDGVTNICDDAFYCCEALTSVTIPDSVVHIGKGAFSETGINKLEIPDDVIEIGDYAFSHCKNLSSVTIPDSVTSMGEQIFRECSSLTMVKIPDSIDNIKALSFENCTSLRTIILPKNITDIGIRAFDGCTGLTDIYYGGTEAEWKSITIKSYNEPLKSAAFHYESTGEGKILDLLSFLNPLRGSVSMKSYKGKAYIAITMASGKTMTGLYKDMVDGGTVELVDIVGTIQDRAGDYVAYQSQNKTNPVATMKVTYADGTTTSYPVVFELYEMEREVDLDISKNIRPIRGKASLAEDAKGDYILVEMVDGQSSVGVYKTTKDGTISATLDGAEGMFTEQEKLYIFYGSQNTTNPEGRLTVTEADGSQKTYRIVFKMYEMDPYVNVAKGLRPVRGAVTFDADGTIRIKMTSGQRSVGLYKTMANGATFKIVDANGRMTNNPSSVMFYMTNNPANVTATMIFTLPDGTTKEQKIIFDMGLEDNPDPLVYLSAVRGTVSYQNDGVEDYIEVKANALSSGVGLYKDCLVKYTITDADGILTENDSRYYVYKSQNPDGLTANINFLQSDGSYKTYKVKFVF